ncbi:hypothetical protein PY257_13905 [Ramlibacter sp. H39-3-26]|uniref:PhaM family polyhydroxyalkanoate granule multifunctional regulatory protein n=1 Tax=Curvibacter soli TaxID=3031331 RepID=UPI0023DA9AEE|nr:PhaM family polyhydroxyalkanoate granule multifunctional regulatory protein [Ramlibacter sp. H39-3-26]MDF1486257.1 hypothetical protein [Ramlibacter sp. H39-3-26]
MSSNDASPFDFGKFVPGFDFLQNLAKGKTQATMPAIPGLSSWVAPTLSVEEIDRRVEELKAVQFWLEQNSRALTATIQALEVQKMTLATLNGMNLSMGDLAQAFTLKPTSAAPAAAAPAPAQSSPAAAAKAPTRRKSAKPAAAPNSVVDPMQWWGALTQQFQQIAASALQDAAPPPGAAPASGDGTAPAPSPGAKRRAPAAKKKKAVRAKRA